MKLPYVIDNQAHVLAGILKDLLSEHTGRSMDVATAYFTVGDEKMGTAYLSHQCRERLCHGTSR